MTRAGYVPDSAGWIFLCGDALTIATSVPDDSALLPELWELAARNADASEVLDALTRGGISSTPDFVIVTLGAPGKVLVRGAASVTVEGSEQKTLTGAGFSSWAELVIDRVDRFVCELGGVDGAVRLPVLGGAVRASSFAADVTGVTVFGAAETPVRRPPARTARASRAAAPDTAPSEATVAAVDEIDEVDDAPAPTDPPVAEDAAEQAAKPSRYDDLFGDTSFRSVEDAAVRPVDDESASPTGVEDRTVVATDLAQLRARRRAGRGRPATEAAPAPAFFVELSTGGTEPLDQPLVIGRAPSAAALAGNRIPRLVTMTTANQDISRTHAQISVEGGVVVVTDLNSRNGTIVTLPGRAAQKLREGETTPVVPGTIIDLGDGATLTVREA